MSANKKKNMEMDVEEDNDSLSETESETDGMNPEAYTGNEEIQVDFEGRNPIDSDFHGIRQLLQQLFLKGNINLSELANDIIAQNYIGSVLIQSDVDGEEEEDEDDEMYEPNMVFAITTALNLTNKQDVNCIQQLQTYLVEKAEKSAPEAVSKQLKEILGNEARPVGFLINERFINLPAQISVPLLENLYKEVKRATEKRMPYNFSYYLILIKFYRGEAKENKQAEDIYSNEEEEVISKEAIVSFEYSVEAEADTGMSGDWLERDRKLTPYRKVVLFEAQKLPEIMFSIKDFIKT